MIRVVWTHSQQHRMYAECRLNQASQQDVCQLQKHMHKPQEQRRTEAEKPLRAA